MTAKTQYRVIAPYVTLKTRRTATGSEAILGFHEGAIVPEDVSEASIKHHLERGLIEEVPANAMPVAAPRGDAGDADPKHGGDPDPDGGKGDPHAGESKEHGAGQNPAPAGSQPGAKPTPPPAAHATPGGATVGRTAQGGKGSGKG
jgi:hypothetical protein